MYKNIPWKILNYIHFGFTLFYGILSILYPERILDALKVNPEFINEFTIFSRSLIGVLSLHLSIFYFIIAQESNIEKIKLYSKGIVFYFLIAISWGFHFVLNDHSSKISVLFKNTLYSWIFYLIFYSYFAFLWKK